MRSASATVGRRWNAPHRLPQLGGPRAARHDRVAIVAVTVDLRLSYGSMGLGAALIAILLAPEAYWPIRRVGQEFHAAADGATALEDVLRHLRRPPPPPPLPTGPSRRWSW